MEAIDRSSWPIGPWDKELDHYVWYHQDISCKIRRGPLGSLCGYIGLPFDHPWYGRSYDTIYDLNPEIEVHGGLTYAGEQNDSEDDIWYWYVGFDCGHYADTIPYIAIPYIMGYGSRRTHYRDVAYVTKQVNSLAEQAKAIQENAPSS